MRQEIDFIKLNPTQNMTILVKTEHPVEEYKHIAAKVMSYDSVYAEQVGFIRQPGNRIATAHLQMAGGEFCGNACMALAAVIASERGLQRNEWTEIVLEASGAAELITCRVIKKADNYSCQVAMPVPAKIEQRTVNYDGSELTIILVKYQQFIHIVIEVDEFDLSLKEKAQTIVELIGAVMDVDQIGILLYKSASDEMAPLIYVPHLESMVWERGCGSGTASLGAYLAWKNKRKLEAKIKQPGGIMHVAADYLEGKLTGLQIEGTVGIVATGKAFIDGGVGTFQLSQGMETREKSRF
ncbi:Diaminopimelate epimerase [Evansella caseinilytica]|uniref:Diaminopimelate epimerase n=1 Tax=Evansella caseinilytica TaxID=1503961 RepID=A0A1H3SMA7_9BACI|nr:diaminopimelate epimerase [Evansella caseinilytica]SDZ38857.1 Diaminopimelate epimerase [Evansella caseinilytica]